MFKPPAQPVISAIFVVYYGIWLLTGTNKQAQMDPFHQVSDKKVTPEFFKDMQP